MRPYTWPHTPPSYSVYVPGASTLPPARKVRSRGAPCVDEKARPSSGASPVARGRTRGREREEAELGCAGARGRSWPPWTCLSRRGWRRARHGGGAGEMAGGAERSATGWRSSSCAWRSATLKLVRGQSREEGEGAAGGGERRATGRSSSSCAGGQRHSSLSCVSRPCPGGFYPHPHPRHGGFTPSRATPGRDALGRAHTAPAGPRMDERR